MPHFQQDKVQAANGQCEYGQHAQTGDRGGVVNVVDIHVTVRRSLEEAERPAEVTTNMTDCTWLSWPPRPPTSHHCAQVLADTVIATSELNKKATVRYADG